MCITVDGLTIDGHDNWFSNTAVLMFEALCPRSKYKQAETISIIMVSVKTAVIPETHYSDYIVHIIETMIYLLVSISAFFIYTFVLWLLGSCGILVFLGFKYYSNFMYQQLAAFG